MSTTITRFNFEVENDSLPVVTAEGKLEDYAFAKYVDSVVSTGYSLDDGDYAAVKKFLADGKVKGWLDHILVAYPFIGNDETARIPIIDKVSDFSPLVKFRTPLFTYLENGKVKTQNSSGGTGTVETGNGFYSPFSINELIHHTPSYQEGKCIIGFHQFYDVTNGVKAAQYQRRLGLDAEEGGGFVLSLQNNGHVSVKVNTQIKDVNSKYDNSVLACDKAMIIAGVNSTERSVYYQLINASEIDKSKNILSKTYQDASAVTEDFEFENGEFPIGICCLYNGSIVSNYQKTDAVYYVAFSDGLMTSSENLDYTNAVRRLLTELGKIDVGEDEQES